MATPEPEKQNCTRQHNKSTRGNTTKSRTNKKLTVQRCASTGRSSASCHLHTRMHCLTDVPPHAPVPRPHSRRPQHPYTAMSTGRCSKYTALRHGASNSLCRAPPPWRCHQSPHMCTDTCMQPHVVPGVQTLVSVLLLTTSAGTVRASWRSTTCWVALGQPGCGVPGAGACPWSRGDPQYYSDKSVAVYPETTYVHTTTSVQPTWG